MFGVGMPEMLLILAVAVMVFGPRRLPELAQTIGRAVGRFRAASGQFQRQVEREMRGLGGTGGPSGPPKADHPDSLPPENAQPEPPASGPQAPPV